MIKYSTRDHYNLRGKEVRLSVRDSLIQMAENKIFKISLSIAIHS